MAGGGEAGHVGAGFGHDDLGHCAAYAGDGLQQLYGVSKGSQPGGYLLVQAGDGGIEEVDVIQDDPGHRAVMGVEAADQRLGPGGDLRAHPPPSPAAQHPASAMSVLRPGTFFTCAALTSHSSANSPSSG